MKRYRNNMLVSSMVVLALGSAGCGVGMIDQGGDLPEVIEAGLDQPNEILVLGKKLISCGVYKQNLTTGASTAVLQLTTPCDFREAALHPETSRLAVADLFNDGGWQQQQYKIHLVDLTTGQRISVAADDLVDLNPDRPEAVNRMLRFSPDGRYLAYASADYEPSDSDKGFILFVIDTATGAVVHRIPELARTWEFSPDSRKLLISFYYYQFELAVLDLATSYSDYKNQVPALNSDSQNRAIDPVWSADGSRIVFRGLERPFEDSAVSLDDSAGSFVGAWETVSYNTAQGGSYRVHAAGDGSATATFNIPPLEFPGSYQFSARFVFRDGGASNARFQVYHDGGVDTVTVDQRAGHSTVKVLGIFSVDGIDDRVVLDNYADGEVSVDAIQVSPITPWRNLYKVETAAPQTITRIFRLQDFDIQSFQVIPSTGEIIALAAARGSNIPEARLYRMGPTGSNPALIPLGSVTPRWMLPSPDGSRLAIDAVRIRQEGTRAWVAHDIYTMNLSSGSLRRVLSDEQLTNPPGDNFLIRGWTADNTRLLVGLKSATSATLFGLYAITADSGAATSALPSGISSIRDAYWNRSLQPSSDWDVEVSSTDTPRSIPDNNSTGITSSINVSESGAVNTLEVAVRITHPYIGDLVVQLTSSAGTSVSLHNRSGGSADNLYKTYTPTAFAGQPVTGTWRLKVTDLARGDTGTLDGWTLRAKTSPLANRQPVASAGASQSVTEGAVVTLSGAQSSDPDGDALSYRWSQTAGPAVTLSSTTAVSPSFTAPEVSQAATLTFSLVVNDGQLDSAPASVSVVVNDGTTGGEIVKSATDTPKSIPDNNSTGIVSSINVGESGAVNTLAVDVRITHTYIGDLVVQLTSPAGTSVTLHNLAGGSADNIYTTYTPTAFAGQSVTGNWQLKVSDRAGGDIGTLDSWTLRIDTSPLANRQPVAHAGADQSVTEGAVVALSGAQSSDPDGDPLSYRWSQTAGPAVALSSTTAANPSFTAPEVSQATTLTFSLVVNDGQLNSAPASVSVVVNDSTQGGEIVKSATDTPKSIPDNNSTGIVSSIAVGESGTVNTLAIDVRITHPYIGDLVVQLTSPAGTSVSLHNRSGGSADNIYKTYAPTQFAGQSVTGNWLLKVSDRAGGDIGTLDSWTLRIQTN